MGLVQVAAAESQKAAQETKKVPSKVLSKIPEVVVPKDTEVRLVQRLKERLGKCPDGSDRVASSTVNAVHRAKLYLSCEVFGGGGESRQRVASCYHPRCFSAVSVQSKWSGDNFPCEGGGR